MKGFLFLFFINFVFIPNIFSFLKHYTDVAAYKAQNNLDDTWYWDDSNVDDETFERWRFIKVFLISSEVIIILYSLYYSLFFLLANIILNIGLLVYLGSMVKKEEDWIYVDRLIEDYFIKWAKIYLKYWFLLWFPIVLAINIFL